VYITASCQTNKAHSAIKQLDLTVQTVIIHDPSFRDEVDALKQQKDAQETLIENLTS
jgi:hypothetical protein